MATIKQYLQLMGNVSFKQEPFCEADLIAISAFSYANFKDSYYFDKESEEGFINVNRFGKSSFIAPLAKNYIEIGFNFRKFLTSFFTCLRYKDVKIGYFEDYFNTEKMIQFFAMTFEIDNKYFIVFRGTDNTITGWKEDFLMGIKEKVPSQNAARDYVKKMIKLLKQDVTIVGHSKGGNLAYYSYFNLPKTFKNKVYKVYNLDGPGFKNDKYDYSEFKKKIVKIVPEDDIVGSLMDESENIEIIQSTKISISQHDQLTWVLDRKNKLRTLKRTTQLTPFARAFKSAMNIWFYSYDDKYIKEMVAFIFKFVDLNSVNTLGALVRDLFVSSDAYFEHLENYDVKTKKVLKDMGRDFINLYFKFLLDDRAKVKDIKEKRSLMEKV